MRRGYIFFEHWLLAAAAACIAVKPGWACLTLAKCIHPYSSDSESQFSVLAMKFTISQRPATSILFSYHYYIWTERKMMKLASPYDGGKWAYTRIRLKEGEWLTEHLIILLSCDEDIHHFSESNFWIHIISGNPIFCNTLVTTDDQLPMY